MYRYVGGGMGLPKMVKSLLIANVAIFFISVVIRINWNGFFGLVPYLVTHKFFVWQFFTYMFLHGGFGHLFWNMFGLWMFGTELEHNWGSKDFLQYYIICGIGGGILVWLTSFIGLSNPIATTIGASGAIFGILAAYGMMWPDRMIFIFGILPMRAINFVIIFGVLDLLRGLTGTGGNIAVFRPCGRRCDRFYLFEIRLAHHGIYRCVVEQSERIVPGAIERIQSCRRRPKRYARRQTFI